MSANHYDVVIVPVFAAKEALAHDIAHVQREAIRWLREVAVQPFHGTLCEKPIVRFEVEKTAPRPLEALRFDPSSWAKCKVHPDHHIQFGRAIYSVPTRYVGMTRIHSGRTKLCRCFTDTFIPKEGVFGS